MAGLRHCRQLAAVDSAAESQRNQLQPMPGLRTARTSLDRDHYVPSATAAAHSESTMPATKIWLTCIVFAGG
jgi:hypothetical protein